MQVPRGPDPSYFRNNFHSTLSSCGDGGGSRYCAAGLDIKNAPAFHNTAAF